MVVFYHWCAVTPFVLISARIISGDLLNGDLKRINTQGKIPAMEYLGCGYDILYGNPLADYGSLIDPGYRNPIISFKLIQHKGKSGRGLKSARISGAWVRPLVSCRRSSEKTIVTSMSEYQEALAVDSEVGAGSIDDSVKFSLSAGYAESAGFHLSTSRRLSIERNYCFLLESALPINGKYIFKKSFKAAVSKLQPNFKAAAVECNTIRYAMNNDHEDCKRYIRPWMDLFELFGTHFSYNIKIGLVSQRHLGPLDSRGYDSCGGGRLTEITQEEVHNSEANSQGDVRAGIDGQVIKGAGQATAEVKNSNQSEHGNVTNVGFTYVNVLGGSPAGSADDEDEYLKWVQSIADNPMPIRSQFAPISKLFKSTALKDAYDDAMEFYMELKGVKGLNAQTKETHQKNQY